MYDTLRYAKELEQAGFSREQSETQVKILKEMIMDGVATKVDISRLESQLEQLESRFTFRTEQHISTVYNEMGLLRRDMHNEFSKLVIRFGGMNIVGFTLLIAVLQWLK